MKWWLLIIAAFALFMIFGIAEFSLGMSSPHTAHAVEHADDMALDPLCLLLCLTEASAVDDVLSVMQVQMVVLLAAAMVVVVAFAYNRPAYKPAVVFLNRRRQILLTTCKRE